MYFRVSSSSRLPKPTLPVPKSARSISNAHTETGEWRREGEGEGIPRVEDPASPRDEKREGERGGDAHPGRVGRDNHWTDTDMLISESFTRDI